jgi:hypothetical protein
VASVCANITPTIPPFAAGSPTLPTWQHVPYPPNSTLTAYTNGASDGVRSSYTFEVVGICADSSTTASVQALYSSGLPTQGWTQSATFPNQGDPTQACGDLYRWKMPASAGTTFFISLEGVHASGTATLFTLRYLIYTVNS